MLSAADSIEIVQDTKDNTLSNVKVSFINVIPEAEKSFVAKIKVANSIKYCIVSKNL